MLKQTIDQIRSDTIFYCPNCKSTNTFWRHGLHFDHLRKCQECQESWDPNEVAQAMIDAEEKRLKSDTTRE